MKGSAFRRVDAPRKGFAHTVGMDRVRRSLLTRFGFCCFDLMFYVYVLQSESDHGLYIGYSANLRRRLAEHKSGMSFSTSYRGPWVLIYYEAYTHEADARGREVFLKSGAGRRLLQKQCRAHFVKKPWRVSEEPL